MATQEGLTLQPDIFQALESVDLKAAAIRRVVNEERGGRIAIQDDSLNDGLGGERAGQVFMMMPETLARVLPGSHVSPADFVKSMIKPVEGRVTPSYEHKADVLTGSYLALDGWSPAFKTEISTGEQTSFKLNVFHGSTNRHAIELSILASWGFKEAETRARYQRELYSVMEPVLAREGDHTIRIVEDCVASADTIMGFLAEVMAEGSLIKADTGKIRIDVAAITAQGTLVLKKFAEDNNLDIELNAGYMAFTLSEGEPSRVENSPARVHANYLNYAPEILSRLSSMEKVYILQRLGKLSGDVQFLGPKRGPSLEEIDVLLIESLVYVVGDMGDAAKGISAEEQKALIEKYGNMLALPWNTNRTDPHGDHPGKGESSVLYFDQYVDRMYLPWPLEVYFANGGYLVREFLEYIEGQKYGVNSAQDEIVTKRIVNKLTISGKRAWSKEGYGVVIGGIPQEVYTV